MSEPKELDWVKESEQQYERRETIRASGRGPTPLNQPWQRDLRKAVDRYMDERSHIPRDLLYPYVLAEILRWARDEGGWNPDHLAEQAAGCAEVFPNYGGETEPEKDAVKS